MIRKKYNPKKVKADTAGSSNRATSAKKEKENNNENDIEEKYYIHSCNIPKNMKTILMKNPHCIEFFCNINNIKECSNCYNYLKMKNYTFFDDNDYKDTLSSKNKNDEYCKDNCDRGYVYNSVLSIREKGDEDLNKNNIDKYKDIKNFYFHPKDEIYTCDQIPYKLDYELTAPKPKTTIHWGQLKMLIVTVVFFIRVIKNTDKKVNVIYAGSATGDNILLLCKMFPMTRWYLNDPRSHSKELYNHPQIKEIKKEYFTDKVAKYYSEKFKDDNTKLLFLSDIREFVDDDSVLNDQDYNINWHKIIQPDFSYLKFRCGYNTDKFYKYYNGEIYLQCYAPSSSTETRLLIKKEIEEKEYNIQEFQGKMMYFNRVIRPSFHKKSIIENNKYFDHCYDCTYFSYIIKSYLNLFPEQNPFDTSDVFEVMMKIRNFLKKYSQDKISYLSTIMKNNYKN